MPSPAHDYPLLILERHLDTFGHVNNATYLQIFEEARWDWITRGGFGLKQVRETGQGPTVLECTLRFQRELFNRTQVNVCSWVSSYVGKIARVHQEIQLEVEGTACEADFLVGLFDTRARKLIDPTPAWLASVGLSQQDWQPSGTAD